MPTGTIVKVVSNRGFGFVSKRGQPDVWFHARDSQWSEEGFTEQLLQLDVEYVEIVDMKNGKPRAVDVRPAR